MTQEEFEKIVDKTCRQAADGMAYMVADDWRGCDKPGSIEVIWNCSNDIWTKLDFIPDNPNLKSVENAFLLQMD